MLDKINKQEYVSIALDKHPPSVDKARVKKVLGRNASQTSGLEKELRLKQSVRVMLTINRHCRPSD